MSKSVQGSLAMCQENHADFLDRLITQDETWVHYHEPETKVQSKQWKHLDSPHPKTACVQPSVGKVMLPIFWDQHGVVMMDFLAQGTTITGTYYASLLQKLREAIKTKRHSMPTEGVRLLQDNAPVHNSHIAQTEAQSCDYEILPHPPYSPDLTLSDFHLFPTMKFFLKSRCFSHDETLISEVKLWLVMQPADFYKRGLHSCIK